MEPLETVPVVDRHTVRDWDQTGVEDVGMAPHIPSSR